MSSSINAIHIAIFIAVITLFINPVISFKMKRPSDPFKQWTEWNPLSYRYLDVYYKDPYNAHQWTFITIEINNHEQNKETLFNILGQIKDYDQMKPVYISDFEKITWQTEHRHPAMGIGSHPSRITIDDLLNFANSKNEETVQKIYIHAKTRADEQKKEYQEWKEKYPLPSTPVIENDCAKIDQTMPEALMDFFNKTFDEGTSALQASFVKLTNERGTLPRMMWKVRYHVDGRVWFILYDDGWYVKRTWFRDGWSYVDADFKKYLDENRYVAVNFNKETLRK